MYRRLIFAVCHDRRRASSGEPLSQLSLPIDAQRWEERNGEDATARDLTIGEFSPVSAIPCLGLADKWVSIDHGTRLSVCMMFDFLIYFTDLNAVSKIYISS